MHAIQYKHLRVALTYRPKYHLVSHAHVFSTLISFNKQVHALLLSKLLLHNLYHSTSVYQFFSFVQVINSWKLYHCKWYCLNSLTNEGNNINRLPSLPALGIQICMRASGASVKFGLFSQSIRAILSNIFVGTWSILSAHYKAIVRSCVPTIIILYIYNILLQLI